MEMVLKQVVTMETSLVCRTMRCKYAVRELKEDYWTKGVENLWKKLRENVCGKYRLL